MMGSSLEGVMINGIPLEKQINWLVMFTSDTISVSGFCDEVKYLEAIQKTLEAEQKRRATNVLLNGGRK
jgi:hypothetical protein